MEIYLDPLTGEATIVHENKSIRFNMTGGHMFYDTEMPFWATKRLPRLWHPKTKEYQSVVSRYNEIVQNLTSLIPIE